MDSPIKPVDEIDAAQASALYPGGHEGPRADLGRSRLQRITATLKVVKELWRWLLDRGVHRERFVREGEADRQGERGQAAARDARGEDAGATPFDRAKQGEEGRWRFWCNSISVCVHPEVLGLTVGAVDGINVFVNGTKRTRTRSDVWNCLRPLQNFLRNTARSDPKRADFR